MSGTQFLTYRGDVANGVNPYRPAEGDMGGTDKENDAEFVPSPNDPEASEWNQLVGISAAHAAMLPMALIDVRFSGGVPFVFAVYSTNPDLLIADIGCADTATGKVTLTIPATKLPDLRWGDARPQATGDNKGVGYRSAAQTLVCEIRTAGSLADVNFMAVWG